MMFPEEDENVQEILGRTREVEREDKKAGEEERR